MKDKDSAFELGLVVSQTHSILDDLVGETKDKMIRDYITTETERWKFPPMPASASTHTAEAAGAVEKDPMTLLFPLEPQLTEEQVSELEEKFGSGLIEEVIDQGWAELKLVGDMEEAKVWEDLEIVPQEGQWVGFERAP